MNEKEKQKLSLPWSQKNLIQLNVIFTITIPIMNSTYNKEDKLDFADNAPVARYLLPQTFNTHVIYNNLITVPHNEKSGYDGVLNDEGTHLLTEAQKNASDGKFKDTLSNYTIERRPSGTGFNRNENLSYLHSFANLYITGDLSNGSRVDTSTIVLFDEKDGWVLTNSGTLYRLLKKLK